MADKTTHLMLDDVYVSITESHDGPAFAVAGYVNGPWANWNALVAHYKGTKKFLLSIAVTADATLGAQALDIEAGDATNDQAPAWVKDTAAAGRAAKDYRYYPKVYTSAGNAQALIDTLTNAGIARNTYMLWSAHYGAGAHICGPKTCGYPQADATQYTDTFAGVSLDGSMCYGYFFSPAPDAPHPPHPGEPELKLGDKGHAVRELQRLLNRKEWAHLKVDGAFGTATEAAVKKWQQEHKLPETGIVNTATWASLFHDPAEPKPEPPPVHEPVLSYNPRGHGNRHVKVLQRALNRKHDVWGSKIPLLVVDGHFGAKTLEAVKSFQKAEHLKEDGIVGKSTWEKLGNYE